MEPLELSTLAPLAKRSEIKRLWPYWTPEEQEQAIATLGPRGIWRNKYIPQFPHPKQIDFLHFEGKEALFGGSAGGGKSSSLLMAALQYVDQPGYSAIIFRRTFQDLSLPSALIPRSQEWLSETDAKWNGTNKTWTFPSGAVFSFGYLEHENDKYRYAGAEFQFIGFDELTQFSESQYRFLFSRLRRLADSEIPTRVRGATNPIGVGFDWVKKRFKIRTDGSGGDHEARKFVPSKLEDNPSLDQEEYESSLDELDKVTRDQLRHGLWQLGEGSKFRREWIRRFFMRGDYYILGERPPVHLNHCRRIITVDPAGTKEDQSKKKQGKHSWAVAAVWDITTDKDLILIHVWRDKVETPDLDAKLIELHREYRPVEIGVETDGIGRSVFQHAKRNGLPVKALPTQGRDKLVRAIPAQRRMELGSVWFPEWAAWLEDWETEIFLWEGDPKQTDDQVDAFSHAAAMITDTMSDSRDLAQEFRRFGIGRR